MRSAKTFKIFGALLCAISFIFLIIAVYNEVTSVLLFIKNNSSYWVYSAIYVTDFILGLSSTILLAIPVLGKDHGMVPLAQGGLAVSGVLEILVLVMFYSSFGNSLINFMIEGFTPIIMLILAVFVILTRRAVDKKRIIIFSILIFIFLISSVITYRASTFFQFAPVLAAAFMINYRNSAGSSPVA